MKIRLFLFFLSTIGAAHLRAQDAYDSGGPLAPEQAIYDVTFYDLRLRIDPGQKSISGSNAVTVRALAPLDSLVLDFDPLFAIDSIFVQSLWIGLMQTTWVRKDSKIWVNLRTHIPEGAVVRVIVHYHGQPREAPYPPWDGGFTWTQTPSGDPWISVSCQNNGADIWWPCKDHPSDEPDSMALRFTVPSALTCISNGQLRDVIVNNDDTRTFYWFVSTPINNYGVSFYIAPYESSDISFTSVTGEPFPMAFWHLEGNENDYNDLIVQIPQQVHFLEELLGPYPFRIDKYTAVQAPYLGMEHQTCIAYGAPPGYHYGPYNQPFDGLHLHELSHEWWGNMITAADWKDFWLHEGFATYMEALYAEHINGFDGYRDVMQGMKNSIRNLSPIAPLESRSTNQVYGIDIYYKGAWVLHTLRYVVGDEAFFKSLRRFLYPDPALEGVKDGRQCRLVSTQEFIETVEAASGRRLDWFFEVYVRRASLPVLQTYIKNKTLHLQWKTEDDIPFPIDVPVRIGEKQVIADMSTGEATILLDPFVAPTIDPDDRILKTVVRLSNVAQNAEALLDFRLEQNYPNPFNGQTSIGFTLPKKSHVCLTVHNLTGEIAEVLFDGRLAAGLHQLHWDAANLPSGVYIYRLQAGDFVDMKKMTLVK